MIFSFCSFVQYEPHVDWPGIKLGSLKWKAGYLPQPWPRHTTVYFVGLPWVEVSGKLSTY